jgi:6-phosphofructokinase 1
MTKRVAILTGGGDVPGLNMCLKSLVYRTIDLGFEPIGVRKGWEGLINYNPDDPSTYSEHFIELTKNMVRPIDRTPGSFLHSSRLKPRQTPKSFVPEFLRDPISGTRDLTDHIQNVITRLGYRAVIVIGDDDTLQYAAHLNALGIPIIAIPKTIHNNIPGTDYSLGFSTGLARGVAFIHELRALAGSREQIVVVETFAAKSGYSTLVLSFLAGADRVIIPETPYDPEKLALLTLQDKRETPANYAVVIVNDGSNLIPDKAKKYAHLLSSRDDAESGSNQKNSEKLAPIHKFISSGEVAADLICHLTGEEVLLQPLTYLLRTGSPDGQDLLGAANFAMRAAQLLYEGTYGRMTALVKEKMWTDVDLNYVTTGVKTVDVDNWYDKENYRPTLSVIWSSEND